MDPRELIIQIIGICRPFGWKTVRPTATISTTDALSLAKCSRPWPNVTAKLRTTALGDYPPF